MTRYSDKQGDRKVNKKSERVKEASRVYPYHQWKQEWLTRQATKLKQPSNRKKRNEEKKQRKYKAIVLGPQKN